MNNIKKIRKQKNLTITELANLIGMSQSNLTKIENNQIELKQETINKIAKALNVSTSAITTASKDEYTQIELLNPELYNLPPLSYWNIPPTIQLNNLNQTKGFIQPDDTMEPTVCLHSLCLIDTSNTSLSNGIFLIKEHNRLSLKRLQIEDNNHVFIISDNKFYHNQTQNISETIIIGKLDAIISHQTF